MTPQHRQTVTRAYGREVQLYSQHKDWTNPPFVAERGSGFGQRIRESLIAVK